MEVPCAPRVSNAQGDLVQAPVKQTYFDMQSADLQICQSKLHWIYTTLLVHIGVEWSEDFPLSLQSHSFKAIYSGKMIQYMLISNEFKWYEGEKVLQILTWQNDASAAVTCRQCRLVTSSSAPKDASAILPVAWWTTKTFKSFKIASQRSCSGHEMAPTFWREICSQQSRSMGLLDVFLVYNMSMGTMTYIYWSYQVLPCLYTCSWTRSWRRS